jgi:hypothetical protein
MELGNMFRPPGIVVNPELDNPARPVPPEVVGGLPAEGNIGNDDTSSLQETGRAIR